MSHEPQIGDRVHATRWNRKKRYHAGDKGTVLRTLILHDGGLPLCVVAMDKDAPSAAGILFNTDEIETDG